MWHHHKLKREKVFCIGRLILFWFLDFTPNVSDVLTYHCFDSFGFDARVVVSQDKHEFLGGMLVKEFEVHLEDHLEQAIVRSAISSDV